jgi:hypothetical protein
LPIPALPYRCGNAGINQFGPFRSMDPPIIGRSLELA